MDPQQPGPSPQPGPYSQPGHQPPPPGPYLQPYAQPYSQPYGHTGAPYPYREPRVVPALPGTPYHRLARTPKHTWWRPILGTVLLTATAFIVMLSLAVAWLLVHEFVAGPFPAPKGADIFPSDTENLALSLVLLAVLTPLVGLAAWMVQRRPFWSVASVLNRIRWRWLLWCCVPALGYVVLSYLMGLLVDAVFPPQDAIGDEGGSWIGFGAFVVPALLILVLVPFQSAAEEFVFRGWVIQAIGAYGPDSVEGRASWLRRVFRSPWPGIVVGGAAFVSAHGYTGWAMADVFLFAVTVGWLTVRTGGLESGIALHATNNLVAFLLPLAMGHGSEWNQQGGAPWTLLVSDAICLGAYAFAVTWLARRREVNRFS
ncbi:CPBP family intramembrane glutamic endopeptidase [Kribbella sp. NPDC059898]|uniref:CPBP family intramembrane glutamic endopeptidase n=1 Tax=Kribbella sp. NPDC059898 TaxID=3346995 RepID=UPI00364C75D7